MSRVLASKGGMHDMQGMQGMLKAYTHMFIVRGCSFQKRSAESWKAANMNLLIMHHLPLAMDRVRCIQLWEMLKLRNHVTCSHGN